MEVYYTITFVLGIIIGKKANERQGAHKKRTYIFVLWEMVSVGFAVCQKRDSRGEQSTQESIEESFFSKNVSK